MTIKQLYPTQRPALDLNFARQKRLDSRVTFTRGSTATYVGSDGLIKTAAANEARFDHDPVTGESLGLLVEEERTNQIPNSQVFTSGYNISGVDTLTQNTTVTTPEGLTDGVGVITESSGGSVHQFYEASSAQVTGYRTYSIFVKPFETNPRNYCVLVTSSFTHDLVNGTTLGSASGEYVSATTTKFPNGWVLCTVTRNHSNTYDQFNFKLAKDGLDDYSYSGDGVSGVYVWGAQVEAGSFPTSYIPTSGSTVTRSAEIASMTGTNLSSWYNQSEGTTYSETRNVPFGGGLWYYGPGGSPRWWSRNERSNGVRTQAYDGSGGSGVVDIVVSGSGVGNIIPSLKHIVTIDNVAQEHAGTANGSSVITGSWDSISGVSALQLGRRSDLGGNNGYLNGHISRLTYYPTRLTNAQLQALTL